MSALLSLVRRPAFPLRISHANATRKTQRQCDAVPVSVTGNAGIGMPIILLHDAEGGIITVELKNGEVCRGLLDEAEDSMNLVLKVLYYCC